MKAIRMEATSAVVICRPGSLVLVVAVAMMNSPATDIFVASPPVPAEWFPVKVVQPEESVVITSSFDSMAIERTQRCSAFARLPTV